MRNVIDKYNDEWRDNDLFITKNEKKVLVNVITKHSDTVERYVLIYDFDLYMMHNWELL